MSTVTAYSIYGYTITSSVMWKSRTNGWTMSRTLAHRTKISKKKRHSRLLDYADLQITLARTHKRGAFYHILSLKSYVRYWIASAICIAPMVSSPSRSAIVRATRRMRS